MLNTTRSYDSMMNVLLKEIAKVIYPKRIGILETESGGRFSCTCEWAVSGIERIKDRMQHVDMASYRIWNVMKKNETTLFLSDCSRIKDSDPGLYEFFRLADLDNAVVVPFYSNGELVGCMCAGGFDENMPLDIKRLMENAAHFTSARVTAHQMMKKLEYMSMYDSLTGVRNRNHVTGLISDINRAHEDVGIIYIDINGLKSVNDMQGHDAGDRLIKNAVELMLSVFDRDCIYRSGGDEFVVVRENVSEAEFEDDRRRLYSVVRQQSEVSMAIGSRWKADVRDLNSLVKEADQEMYAAKTEYYRTHKKLR